MDKTEVYSWRLDPKLKDELLEAARSEKTSVANLLERLAREWLEGRGTVKGAAGELRRRAALSAIIRDAETQNLGGPATPSATAANLRKAFQTKSATRAKADKSKRHAG